MLDLYLQIQAGLSALEDAMEAGFDDFKARINLHLLYY